MNDLYTEANVKKKVTMTDNFIKVFVVVIKKLFLLEDMMQFIVKKKAIIG